MTTATLTFNLSDEDDIREYEIASNAQKYLRVLQEFKGALRAARKYENWLELCPKHGKFTESDLDLITEIEEEFYNLLQSYDINLDV